LLSRTLYSKGVVIKDLDRIKKYLILRPLFTEKHIALLFFAIDYDSSTNWKPGELIAAQRN